MLKKKRLRKNIIPKNISFLSKLYDILNDSEYYNIIHWNDEGNGIVIIDIDNLCKKVLPKYYNHTNYSSFVRQLNMYGFSKTKNALKEDLCFEHNIFNKNNTKEEIREIIKQNKIMKNVFNYIKYNENKEEINNLTVEGDSSNDNFNNHYLFKYLLYQIEESKNNIFELKKEIDILKTLNKDLKNKLLFLKTKLLGHTIFLKKIIKNNNNTINNSNNSQKKSKNIKELFKKYLYYLKIYSPYVFIKGNITEKVHSFEIGKSNIKNIINNIHCSNFTHNESIFDD